MFDIRYLCRMHLAILNRKEKKHFLLLSFLFLFTSVFDIVGISAIGSFLVIMMDPSILHQLPIISSIFPKSWSTSQTLILLGSLILVLFLLKTAMSCIVQKKLITYCFEVGARIRIQLMEQYMYAPYSYFVSSHTSEMINRILNYASSYSSVSLVSFMLMLVHSTFVLAIISFLLIFNPLVTVLLIVMFGSMLALHLIIFRDKLYHTGQTCNSTNQQIMQSVQEGISGLKEVRILSKENFFLERIRKASLLNAEAYGFILVFQKLPFYFLESVMFVFIIGLCIGELSLGVKVQAIIALCGMIATAGIRLLPSLYQIAVAIVSTQSNQHTLEIIYDNLFNFDASFNNELPWPKQRNIPKDKFMPPDFSTIQFENVSYRYPGSEKFVLDNISLTIQRGHSIGIIGPSGAGKSTLIDLLLGLLVPTKGRIVMDGQPLTDPKAWVDRFAYIPQIIHLLDASIKENIVFGDPTSAIDVNRLERALQMAQLQDVVANLPDGVDTIIGENGIKLSGGQRQRIALARSFYHEREIIVMDEATAALDNETEHEVVEAIKSLRQIKTLIIIAHRYTTVEHCDIIYRLHQGSIADCGSFKQVIGQYQSSLVQKSNLSLEQI